MKKGTLPFMRSSRFLPFRSFEVAKNEDQIFPTTLFTLMMTTQVSRHSTYEEVDSETDDEDEEYGGDDEFLSVFVSAIVSC